MAWSRRSLLAALWSIVGILTVTSFIIALLFARASSKYDYSQNGNYDWRDEDWMQRQRLAVSVSSRAMVFAAIWTAVLSGILVIAGTVTLGIFMPNGEYYTCCVGNVHRTTPLSLGAFGGSLLMFANLTLVCAILFGEFEVTSFGWGQENIEREDAQDDQESVVDQSSFAFSIMCVFFTIMYAGFALLIFWNSNALLEESVADAREEESNAERPLPETNDAPGYFFGGDRFGVGHRRPYAAAGTQAREVI